MFNEGLTVSKSVDGFELRLYSPSLPPDDWVLGAGARPVIMSTAFSSKSMLVAG